MITVLYSFYDTPDVKKTGLSLECLKIEVNKILNDPRGWKKYGYQFEEISNEDNKKIRSKCFGILSSNKNKPIELRFLINNNMKKIDKCLDGLSCYHTSKHSVYININNWLNGGVDPFPSKNGEDGIMRYRNYVITHEFGHALGFDHPKCKKGINPVMEQMTKGLTNLNRCEDNKNKWIELNEWPLDCSEFDEEKGDNNILIYKGGGRLKIYIHLILLTLLTIIVVIYLINEFYHSKFISDKKKSGSTY